MKRGALQPVALAAFLTAWIAPAAADDILIHFWGSGDYADYQNDRVLLYDSSTSTTVQMTVENFLRGYEQSSLLPKIAIVHARQTGSGDPPVGQSIADSTPTAVEFDETLREDDADMHDESTNNTRLISQLDGFYLFHATVEFEGGGSAFPFEVSVKKGGATSGNPYSSSFPVNEVYARARQELTNHGGPLDRSLSVTGTVYLEDGQYLELIVEQDSGSSKNLLIRSSTPASYPSMYMRRLLQ